MKTIEERAKEYAPDPRDPDYILYSEAGYVVNRYRDAYIAGATEQKAIDIEKACEWLGPHLAEVADLYDSTAGLLLRLVKENFRIAMEKEL